MFILYETTNNVNGKKYIGVHNRDDDDYLGSGNLIVKAVKRYGRQNFSRVILERFETAAEAYLREAEVVTPEICKSTLYYNINLGGFQPPDHTGMKRNSPKYREANLRRWRDPEYRERVSAKMSEKHHKSQQITLDGITYPSKSAAARALGISRHCLAYRLTKIVE